MRNGTRKIFKVGDQVWMKHLVKGGPPEEARWGLKEGTIVKIQVAGELGARAMDCGMDDLIHWIRAGDCMYPKFACELRKIPQIPEGWFDDVEEE